MQKYFHRPMSPRVGTIGLRREEAEKVKPCEQDCSCCVRSKAFHLLTHDCQQKSYKHPMKMRTNSRWRVVMATINLERLRQAKWVVAGQVSLYQITGWRRKVLVNSDHPSIKLILL